MRVAVAFDHRGIELRGRLLAELDFLGHEVVDLGTDAPSPKIDYPDKVRELAHALTSGVWYSSTCDIDASPYHGPPARASYVRTYRT